MTPFFTGRIFPTLGATSVSLCQKRSHIPEYIFHVLIFNFYQAFSQAFLLCTFRLLTAWNMSEGTRSSLLYLVAQKHCDVHKYMWAHNSFTVSLQYSPRTTLFRNVADYQPTRRHIQEYFSFFITMLRLSQRTHLGVYLASVCDDYQRLNIEGQYFGVFSDSVSCFHRVTD